MIIKEIQYNGINTTVARKLGKHGILHKGDHVSNFGAICLSNRISQTRLLEEYLKHVKYNWLQVGIAVYCNLSNNIYQKVPMKTASITNDFKSKSSTENLFYESKVSVYGLCICVLRIL